MGKGSRKLTSDQSLKLWDKSVVVKYGFKYKDYEIPQGSQGKVVGVNSVGCGYSIKLLVRFQKQPQFQVSEHEVEISDSIFLVKFSLLGAG